MIFQVFDPATGAAHIRSVVDPVIPLNSVHLVVDALNVKHPSVPWKAMPVIKPERMGVQETVAPL